MARQPQVAIVADSAISLSQDIVEEYGIHVVPIELIFQGSSYKDGQDLMPSNFYRMLRTSSQLPTTSAPSPETFLQAFERAGIEARSILCLTISSSFSATFNNARIAVDTVKDSFPHLNVELLDTGTAAGGEALIALEAARVAQSGSGLEEVTAAAKRVSARVGLIAFIDTLYFLWKGGRVPRIGLWAASILKIKPLMEMSQGEVNPVAKPRTRSRATERLVSLMRQRVGEAPAHVSVMHADSLEEARALKERIGEEFNCSELFVSEFTPVMGAHTGPGLLGLAFWSE